jgi:hypothetical protein
MRFLSIDTSNYNKPIKTQKKKTIKRSRPNSNSKKMLTRIQLLNHFIQSGKHVFLLIYMEGCGPCSAARPEWKKVENVLSEKYKNKYDDIIVVDIDHMLLKYVKLPLNPAGFPNMKYIAKKGKYTQEYEDADITSKNRQVDSFIEWIEKTIQKNNIPSERKMYGGFVYNTTRNTSNMKNTKNTKKGGRKWSMKYKKSINCSHPKGFSQKQYCKYGRK